MSRHKNGVFVGMAEEQLQQRAIQHGYGSTKAVHVFGPTWPSTASLLAF